MAYEENAWSFKLPLTKNSLHLPTKAQCFKLPPLPKCLGIYGSLDDREVQQAHQEYDTACCQQDVSEGVLSCVLGELEADKDIVQAQHEARQVGTIDNCMDRPGVKLKVQ